MQFCALASGSSGNCFYIEKEGKGVLIDCGISSKQIIERLALLKKSPEKIKAIFVTHEHSDHTKGIDVFASRFEIPIYATNRTARSRFLCREESLIQTIKNKESVKVGRFNVEAFPKSHDAADPVSYHIEDDSKSLAVITDLGYGCKNVIEHISTSDGLILESNHDPEMLKNGPYPGYLKKWVASDLGHLSNNQAALLVLEHANSCLKRLVLSHLSENNNTEEIALKTMKGMLQHRRDLKKLKISISGRYEPTSVMII